MESLVIYFVDCIFLLTITDNMIKLGVYLRRHFSAERASGRRRLAADDPCLLGSG